jgi:diphthamide biosynthesis enzyme Dph1/Dph2-like protein
MKTLFIPVKINSEVNEKKIQSLELPNNIAIAYSIQYKDIAFKIKEILSKKIKITDIVQVLGCSKPKFSKGTKAVLLVSSGDFHAVSLAFETKLPIYILESDKLRKISDEDVYAFEKQKLASYMKFLNSEKVGILISTKPGQENLKKAISLKNKLKDKKCYLFLGNEIDTFQFENFSEIQSWVNTACPRLDFEGFVFNAGDLNSR